ncbi:DNA alkylation repair protein [Pseudaestuariivita rosea]|uniref:DNA alkylation repair protein n=1 Tax=Pseudaestuariivita rosea TaxID=2763263 RepID=UPI001ABADA55|nr:DNA alkylation repair protein [Pseudaestuariivita rosea]
MQLDDALAQMRARAVAGKADDMAAYHKAQRDYLGVSNPDIDTLTKAWRKDLSLDQRLNLAAALWQTNIHEARIAAAKLLTQARIRPDDTAAWDLIKSWVPDFDAWAIADHASIAGQKRLVWEPERADQLEPWTRSDHMWTRRAVLVMTLPWTKQNHPKPDDLAIRQRVLDWAAGYVTDPEWFIQKAVAWWLRELSKHDATAVQGFLEEHGSQMKPFARREAGKYL